MKNIFGVLSIIVILLAVTVSCNARGQSVSTFTDTITMGENDKILIVYFSRHGSSVGSNDVDATSSASLAPGDTITIANMIAALTNGDRHQIITTEPYPKNYRETTRVASREKKGKARPQLTTHIENMDTYKAIILGYPNWWGTIPMPIATFLESYDFTDKYILPYCTHGGSRLGSSIKDIVELVPTAIVADGIAIHRNDVNKARNDVADWLRGYGIIE